ncbi:MAG: BolA/IbaG family iron-sulfur metabolism protein [Gammaproteobacteria bacterium]|nr:BolA/IbaG family iron-sulfur metabolism protein [Gammaproteobacteria bacterium]MBU1556773.1 BolA/IbaG family iron-sulfur metabolism protein [Gammaproteobacteria bacterium]MBU2072044.1 BolA/IbaG family iron-sulfur metabolism protein [Gammaproteobacteria bacterium]MBU2183465.1 BolA/IbaG family iron-sulfur metabolism protein [Gammaproteobacteria bacterium]MBU2203375.1 BolA/IbaG family iron-sulfur metabolism protein [Gammaproteobacteria bacterium]
MLIHTAIEQKLLSAFDPVFLDVVNESYLHNVPQGSESHFKVVIVTPAFDGLRLLQRHRAVNAVVAEELAEKIHALALHTYTPSEWYEYYAEKPPASPRCYGGSKLDKPEKASV